MGRPAHPLRDRAVQLMRRGLAMPREIADACGLPVRTVYQWRRRAELNVQHLRRAHVRMLMEKGHVGDSVDRPEADTVADRAAVGSL